SGEEACEECVLIAWYGVWGVAFVLVRRPLNDQEKTRNTLQVVSAIPDRRQVKINYGTGAKRVVKTFTFDRVFGQYASQEEVFRETVLPVVDEALQGYISTVFA